MVRIEAVNHAIQYRGSLQVKKNNKINANVKLN